MAIQDSYGFKGRTGTGLHGKKKHSRNKNGYCRSCRSRDCYMVRFVPKYDYIWTWAEIYDHTVNTYPKEEN